MKFFKNSLLLSILASYSAQADFTQLSVWQRKTASGAVQALVMCGDNHGKKSVGYQQAHDLAEILSGYTNSSIIIEDTFDYRSSLDMLSATCADIKGFTDLKESLYDFQINRLDPYRRKAVLDAVFSGILMVPVCAQEAGIPCRNVEFRQFIVDLIHDTYAVIQDHQFDPVFIAKQIVDTVYAEVSTFNDAPALNDYYAQVLDNLEQIKNLYEQFMLTNRPASEFFDYVCDLVLEDPKAFDITCLTYTSSRPSLVAEKEKTCTLYRRLLENKRTVNRAILRQRIESDFMGHAFSALIDVYLLHTLYTHQVAADSGNMIAMCVGIAHGMCIEQMLPQFGYECVASIKDDAGLDLAASLNPIEIIVSQPESNGVVGVVLAMVDGVKAVIDTIGSYFGLA